MENEKSKVIDINRQNKPDVTYRFVKDMKMEIKTYKNGVKRNENTVVIMLEQNKDGIIRRKMHPLTQYLLEPKKKGGKYSPITQSNKASVIVKFLNYILIDNSRRFKLKDFNEILFEHGCEFINSLPDVSDDTVDRYARYLTDFYYYLATYGLLKYITVDDFTFTKVNTPNGSREVIEVPFYDLDYGRKDDGTLIHKIPSPLIIPFLDTAIMHAPEIALGICFQLFGGLRVGEVVNLKKSSVKVKGNLGEFGFILNLRNKNMRDDLKHPVAGGSVKKTRRQAVFPFGGAMTQKIYKMHMKQINPQNKQNALFVNKDGNPMADFTYRYYFSKVKNKFIERLKESKHAELRHYAIELGTVRWSTHIGRGTFSNIISNISENILEIAQARGDDCLDSSLVYLTDSDKMAITLYDNDIEMWEMLNEIRKSMNTNNKGDKK